MIPDGEPMLYGRDFQYAEHGDWTLLGITEAIRRSRFRSFADLAADILIDDDSLTLELTHRGPAVIPYDEMRAILGLPDVRAEVEQMSLRLAFQKLDNAFRRATAAIEQTVRPATAWTVHVGVRHPGQPAGPDPDSPQQRAVPRPSTTPPMWANNPTRTRRRRNR